METRVVGTKISKSGQATIPAMVRDALRADIGATIYWAVDPQGNATVSASPSFAAAHIIRADSMLPVSQREQPTPSLEADYAAAPAVEAPCCEWPSSFWQTLGALDDPSFTVPEELDYEDDARRLTFD